jgi:hypothetical protein
MRQYGVRLLIHVQEQINLKKSTPVIFFLNPLEYNTSIYRAYQNDWSGLEVDYIHKYGEETYKY